MEYYAHSNVQNDKDKCLVRKSILMSLEKVREIIKYIRDRKEV